MKMIWDDVLAKQVLEVYRWVLKQRVDKPDFGRPFRGEEKISVSDTTTVAVNLLATIADNISWHNS